MNLDDSGVLFVVTGAHYTAAAGDAARSVAQTNPWLKIGIFSDQDVTDPVFTFVGKIQGEDSRRKHEYVGQSPFAKTLYLDSDIRVVSDLSDLFRLLERYEIAGAHVRYRSKAKRLRKNKLDLPQSFPQINCGVLLYKKSGAVDSLFKLWNDIYVEGGFSRDQNSLPRGAMAIGHQILRLWPGIQHAQHTILAGQAPIAVDPPYPRVSLAFSTQALRVEFALAACSLEIGQCGAYQGANRLGARSGITERPIIGRIE